MSQSLTRALQVRCFFIDEGKAFVELPLCSLGNFGAWLLMSPRQEADVFSALFHVLRAVEWLHQQEVVHCDIRKENVLVDQQNGTFFFYLSDFDVSDSLARSSTRGTMTSLGARGFDSQLTMAPEVRAGSSCTFETDMFSFGGLLFAGMFHEYCHGLGTDSLPTTSTGEIVIPAGRSDAMGSTYDDVELRDVLGSLLHPNPTERLTASQTLSHSFFAASGGKAKEEALTCLAQLADQKLEMEKQDAAAEEKWRERMVLLREKMRHLEKQGQANVQQDKELRKERAALQTKLRDLAAQKAADEQAARRKKAELEQKEKEVKSAQQRLLKTSHRPKSWSTERPSSGLKVVHITEKPLLATLESFLTGKDIGYDGQDKKEKGKYNALKLERAWRVENDELWMAYVAAKSRIRRVRSNVDKLNFPSVSLALDRVSRHLPDGVDVELNETRLVHGTKPDVIASVLRNGMNERFSGSSSGTAFGDGVYLAEDAAKSDQYGQSDSKYQPSNPLHHMLYGASNPRPPGGLHGMSTLPEHPGQGVFYILVCRVVLGYALFGVRDYFNPNSKSRELKDIQGVFPPTPHHSLIAQGSFRYKEIILFHGDQVYPEYLLAYRRTRS
uniref:Poly [ADP-ribose] polymerase n=1 Tax=Hemiselmis andersenii TaxID=464988 RepID=A0A6U4XDW1_HEMAN|mmetsp:Transcript_35192/g.85652  ORF Transcript_35192/g.85652 Transcript_35192/m.85652 type:complete len:613 (+) Transcript_35192:2706-4544(+)